MLFALLQLIARGAHVHVSGVAAAFGYALPLFVSLKMHCTGKSECIQISYNINLCITLYRRLRLSGRLHAAVCIAESQRVSWADMTVRNAFSPTFMQFNFHLFLLACRVCNACMRKSNPHRTTKGSFTITY